MPESISADRPIYARLPFALQYPPDLEPDETPIADSITEGADRRLKAANLKAEEFARIYCHPQYCPAQYLDWLASVLLSAEFVWWDASWSEDQKRRILMNLPLIRRSLGSIYLFNDFLAPNFDLDAELQPYGGWIVGGLDIATPLPADLAGGSLYYQVLYAQRYSEKSREYQLIQKLIVNFFPQWIEYDYTPMPDTYFV